jgi:hypothetical protein
MKVLILIVTSVLISFQTYADTDSSLKSMMSSAATRAGGSLTFTSAASISKNDIGGFNRTAVDLGGMRFRTPVESFNVVSYTKPNISAGCNGVDLTLGSFSFLSKDELIAMFRSIASNALTYAFGQAIKGMCPDCWTMMNSLQTKMQDLNQMFSNTCSTAICMRDEGCRTESLGNTACLFTSGWTKDNDYSGCKDKAKENGDHAAKIARIKDNEAAGEKAPFMMGNMTYQMIENVSVDIASKVDAFRSIFKMQMSSQELLMSLIGTVIIDENGNVSPPIEATLNFSDLFNNAGDETNPGDLTTKFLDCIDDATFSEKTYECFVVKQADVARDVIKVDEFIAQRMSRLVVAISDFTDATLTSLSPMELYILNYIEPHLINAIIIGDPGDKELSIDLIKEKAPYIAARLKDDFSTAIVNLLKGIVQQGHKNQDSLGANELLNTRLKELKAQQEKFQEESKAELKSIAKSEAWLVLKRNYSVSMANKIADLMDGK